MNMVTTWSSLPADLQELVLAQLLPAELTRVSRVCREWKSATDSPNFRRLYRWVHVAVKPSLLLYSHDAQIHGIRPNATWHSMPSPAANVREWAGSGGVVCVRSQLDKYTAGWPSKNTWRDLPAPPPPASPATLTKLWAAVAVGARFWIVLLHRTLSSLSLSIFDSETNQWTPVNSNGHLLSSYSDTAHTVGSVIYSIQPQTRSVVSFDVRSNRWSKLGAGENFLPPDLVFDIRQRFGCDDVLIDTPAAMVEGHRRKLSIVGASSESGHGVVWELDRAAQAWRVVGNSPPEMWREMVEEAVECRKGGLLPVRFSGSGELAVIMTAGAQRALQYDVIRGSWSWLELPPAVNCELNLCFGTLA